MKLFTKRHSLKLYKHRSGYTMTVERSKDHAYLAEKAEELNRALQREGNYVDRYYVG